jgi:uncharacterized membrane protein
MTIACGYCGAPMPDISEFCPACGRPVREGTFFAPESKTENHEFADESARTEETSPALLPSVQMNDRLVGAFVYCTFIPAVIFLFLKQYRERKFVRFHAFQSISFWAGVVALLVLGLLASTFGWPLIWLVIGALVFLGLFFTWALLSIKALQGEWFELPWLGPWAGQQAER